MEKEHIFKINFLGVWCKVEGQIWSDWEIGSIGGTCCKIPKESVKN